MSPGRLVKRYNLHDHCGTTVSPAFAAITEGPRPDQLAQQIHRLQKRSTQFCAAHGGFTFLCGDSTCSGDITFSCSDSSFCASTSDANSALWGCCDSDGSCDFGSTACVPYTSLPSYTSTLGIATLSWWVYPLPKRKKLLRWGVVL